MLLCVYYCVYYCVYICKREENKFNWLLFAFKWIPKTVSLTNLLWYAHINYILKHYIKQCIKYFNDSSQNPHLTQLSHTQKTRTSTTSSHKNSPKLANGRRIFDAFQAHCHLFVNGMTSLCIVVQDTRLISGKRRTRTGQSHRNKSSPLLGREHFLQRP